jgi:hypothetical protein
MSAQNLILQNQNNLVRQIQLSPHYKCFGINQNQNNQSINFNKMSLSVNGNGIDNLGNMNNHLGGGFSHPYASPQMNNAVISRSSGQLTNHININSVCNDNKNSK